MHVRALVNVLSSADEFTFEWELEPDQSVISVSDMGVYELKAEAGAYAYQRTLSLRSAGLPSRFDSCACTELPVFKFPRDSLYELIFTVTLPLALTSDCRERVDKHFHYAFFVEVLVGAICMARCPVRSPCLQTCSLCLALIVVSRSRHC